MKKYLLTTVIVFFAFVIALNAQEEKEKKKVHIKVVKEENGELIEIDTVFDGEEEGMYFLKNIDVDGEEIDIEKIIEKLDIEGHEGMKYIIKTDKGHSKDSLKHIWHSMDGDMEGDSVKIKKMVFVSKDGDKELIEIKEGNVFIDSEHKGAHKEHYIVKGDEGDVKIIKSKGGKSVIYVTDEDVDIDMKDHKGMNVIKITEEMQSGDSLMNIWYNLDVDDNDSLKIEKLMFISEDGDKKVVKSKDGMIFISSDSDKDGEKVKVMKSKSGDVLWTTKEGEDHKILDGGKVIVYKTGDATFDIIKSEDGDHKIVKEIIVNKDGSIEKKIEVIVTEDGDHSIVKIIGDEGDLENIEENVKIYKYKSEDGTITVKADIDIDEDGKSSDKKIKKEFVKIKVSPNPTDGKFNLEFELSKKESVVIKVNNEEGKSVYSKKVKKFNGSFSEEIDITKEDAGAYIIQIIQGDKTIERKIKKN